MAYDEAVRQALIEAMTDDERVFVLGEDVGGRYGGAFGVTRGLAKQFGAGRCLNMPIAESAIIGCAVGAAIEGLLPVAEMQFADFLATGFNALVNNAAKQYWRSGRRMPLVVRLPYGGATGTMNRLLGGGPFHSQCPEMWFLRTPGWKIVAPSTPRDAKGLMMAAIRDPNPVIFLESKGLYGFFRNDLREEVPLGADFEVPIGQAALRREGQHVSVLTYGAMTWTALAAAEELHGKASSSKCSTCAPCGRSTKRRSKPRRRRPAACSCSTRTPAAAASAASSRPCSPTACSGSSTLPCAESRLPTRRCPTRRRSSTTSCPRPPTSWRRCATWCAPSGPEGILPGRGTLLTER